MRYLSVILIGLLLVSLTSCSDEADNNVTNVYFSQTPDQIVKIGGDGQTGTPGSFSEDPLVVRILSEQGKPVENVSVFFSTVPPHGVEEEVVLTDANGLAFTSVLFGDRAGSFEVASDVPTIAGSPVVFSLATSGDASAVESREIGTLDIPLSLVNVGDIFGEYLHEISVLDQTLFIPTGSWGNSIVVVDLQNPTAPRMAFLLGGIESRDLAVAGNILCSVSGNDFNTLDISNPHVPTLLGFLEVNPGSGGAAATTVAAAGNVAFVTGGGSYLGGYGALQSIDFSDPTNPQLGVDSDESGGADVVIDGQYAFVAAYEDGLFVFDINNPLISLPKVGSLGTGGNATRIRYADGMVYVLNIPQSSNTSSVAIIDVNDPTAPVLSTIVSIPPHWHFPGYGYDASHFGMDVYGGNLFLGGYLGVVVIDISDPENPEPLGRVDPRRYVGGITQMDGKLAIATSTGLSVIEISPIEITKGIRAGVN